MNSNYFEEEEEEATLDEIRGVGATLISAIGIVTILAGYFLFI